MEDWSSTEEELERHSNTKPSNRRYCVCKIFAEVIFPFARLNRSYLASMRLTDLITRRSLNPNAKAMTNKNATLNLPP
jgi:hypothetical protein